MSDYRPNPAGVPAILNGSWVEGLVTRAAANTASGVNLTDTADDGDTVVVDAYEFKAKGRTVTRHARSVTIRLPHARLLEIRDGVLTRAAAAAGLEVKAR